VSEDLPDDVAYAGIRAYLLARFPYDPSAYELPGDRERHIDYDVRGSMPDPAAEGFARTGDEPLYALMRVAYAAGIKRGRTA
jgi:hypothetical protein